MREIIFLVVFILLIPIVFRVLRSMEIEKKFKQGRIVEIRIAYMIFSIIIAEILTQALERIFYSI